MKNFLLAITFVVIGTNAIAQKKVNLKHNFGVTAGVNISDMSEYSEGTKVGFNTGVFYRLDIGKFSIQPELLFNQKGSKIYNEIVNMSTYTVERIDATSTLSYISLPIMVQLRPTKKLALEVGPEFSYLIRAKTKSKVETFDTKEAWEPFDPGFSAGASYEIIDQLSLGVRYTIGLNNLSKYTIYSNKNRNFQVGLSYNFAK